MRPQLRSETDSGQYGSNRGPDALLDAFIEHMRQIGLTGYERRNCVTGDGAKHVLYNLFEALLNEGDGISFPVPYWTSYFDIAEIVGARVALIPASAEQNYKITPQQLDEALANKPKVFLFNNPSNPTGMVYDESEVAGLAAVLVKYPDTWIIMDDIYNRMLFDGLKYTNFVLVRPELRDRAVFVDSLSKTYGMPGWRLGFAAGPESIINAVVTLNSNHITSVNEMVNAAGIAALTGPQDIPSQKCAEFASKRDQVMAVMNAIPGVVCPRPQGAFYASRTSPVPSARPTSHPAARSGTTWISARHCWTKRTSPAFPARHSGSRVRCASATPVRRRNCSRGWTGSQNFSPN